MVSESSVRAYESPVHVFSIDDVMGGFGGSTFGTTGATQDNSIICGLPESTETCPEDNGPITTDKSGVVLYPVDSEFGYYIVDFLGAQGKARDGDYLEGFVGNIVEGTDVIGIQVSNAATEKYKVKPPLGTWCQGLGGTSVKCETEHYTTMEHVLTCHETIPYSFADPLTGEQAILSTPDDSLRFDCANAPLDDNAIILVDGAPDTRLINSTPCEDVGDPEGCQMFPNDKTDMQNDIALSSDYSVQLKDDGKPLYGWGGLHKRPNDIRMYVKLPLPAQWKGDENYEVTKAELVINHWVTNNPNDQLRPEDLENEAATGRKPSYAIEGTIGGADEVWKSLVPCYEGDGDLIDTEEGANDPTFIGVGTYLKNMPFALVDPEAEPPPPPPGVEPAEPPYAFSSDLQGAFTNAFYTTINRDPFEWSYDANPDPLVQDFVGSPVPDDTLGELVSGPRWRLKPNKFGQDLPGLEIPLIECSPPPFQSDNTKYVVGTPVTTIINLLDWDEATESPLSTSKGWVDVTSNEFVTIKEEVNGIPITTNGLPMTDDLDLAVYVKGDRKSTAIYNVKVVIEYEGEIPVEPTDFDLALSFLDVPARVLLGETTFVAVEVTNNGPAAAGGPVTLSGVSNRGELVEFTADIDNIAAGETVTVPTPPEMWEWTAPDDKPATVSWTAEVTADGDVNPSNDTAVATTKVRKN